MCAFAIGTARDWLFRCREMMESQSFAPTGTSMANATALTEQGETKLKLGCNMLQQSPLNLLTAAKKGKCVQAPPHPIDHFIQPISTNELFCPLFGKNARGCSLSTLESEEKAYGILGS